LSRLDIGEARRQNSIVNVQISKLPLHLFKYEIASHTSRRDAPMAKLLQPKHEAPEDVPRGRSLHPTGETRHTVL